MYVENIARVIVSDFHCPAEEISRILDVQPTETWRRGDRVLPVARNVHRENGWMIASPVDPKVASLEEAIDHLLNLFPDINAFNRLPPEATVEVSCVIYSHDVRPSFSLSARTLARLVKCRAQLDIDAYEFQSGSTEKQV